LADKVQAVKKDNSDGPGGYGRPPRSTRFRKGQTGNPKGRPKGTVNEVPYEAVLGQMVIIREEGRERQVTAAEAFILKLTKSGLEGDGPAMRIAIAAIQNARNMRDSGLQQGGTLVFRGVSPGNPNLALLHLRIASKLDRYRKTARVVLEPWMVEAALARLGDRRLTPQEQDTVLRATRTPHKVKWPSWWEARS
jgi:hypothetical protein